MSGLRRLAMAACEGHYPAIDIEIPCDCDSYIESKSRHAYFLHMPISLKPRPDLDKMYMVNPPPPLITNPGACSSLTTTALQVNLAAHASCNPSISQVGNHAEMAARLKEILIRREMDLVVAQMLRG